jgi:iron(III) transport system substrate-binding protein
MMLRRVLAMVAFAAVVCGAGVAKAQFGPPELIEAAKKEGRLVFYTANFAEVEQEVIKAFNRRFPEIRIEMVRAPGGQLITRFKTEAAAGKLAADVMSHSDRGLMREIEDQFLDYAPPNASDYRDDARVSAKLWPAITVGWAIAYNSALVQNPPKTWMDLIKPEYKGKKIGQVVAPGGGTTWTRSMFERQVLGEDYHAKQAALGIVLYPSGAPLADSLVRGEIEIGPLLYNLAFTKIKEGAPLEAVFPPEGVPIIPYSEGIPKSAKNPNAARLFINWRLSAEGQTFLIKELGHLTSLKTPPFFPKGWDPKVVKVWSPNFEQFEKLRESWIADWNRIYNYRQ